MANADMVIEAVPENMEIKHELRGNLRGLLGLPIGMMDVYDMVGSNVVYAMSPGSRIRWWDTCTTRTTGTVEIASAVRRSRGDSLFMLARVPRVGTPAPRLR
ncbi:hypothetical protein ACX3O0_04475 [Homoserinimonas sp. A447]